MLTIQPFDPYIDLDSWVGQRSATFKFNLSNGVTGQKLGELHPIRGSAQLTHDTQRTTKRQLNLALGVADTALIDPITARVEPFMVLNGVDYPLGRYMFVDYEEAISTGGTESSFSLTDEMFLVDQQITTGFNTSQKNVAVALIDLLSGLSVSLELEATPYVSVQSWGIGVNRGSIIEALAITGDYFSPWFGNDAKLHIIRSFDPAKSVADFDYDSGNQVIRDSITHHTELLTAPNRFVVISNSANEPTAAVTASADVPVTAPHSVPNRGFVIADVQTLQVIDFVQAQAVAINLALRQTVFEQTTLSTPPDPRHDSYDVIGWNGSKWLETAWSMSLTEGAAMTHTLRKVYA